MIIVKLDTFTIDKRSTVYILRIDLSLTEFSSLSCFQVKINQTLKHVKKNQFKYKNDRQVENYFASKVC